MPQIHELSAAELARQIRQRTITPVEVAQSFLERMDALEPQLEAWVRVDRETVLADAQQRQEELESGAATGPLHGVPIGIKDIYHIAGIPTTAGSKVYADYVPDETAVTIDLLRNAGAVILGKTVTTEFACLDPSHTKNPWNPAHTPGGSSSGSAVSVAVRMCPVAMGSQTIGSVLRPASYNGVTGFKPTYGRVSRRGVVPVSWSLDTVGWMGRTVEDMALLLQVMAGPDEQDPVASRLPAGDYLSDLESSGPPRIGLITSFFMEESDQETQKQTRAVLERLSSAGASVVELTLPESFNTAFQDQMIIMGAEAAAFHKPMYEKQAQDYRPKLREMLRQGLATDATTYSKALERRLRFSADMRLLAEQADVLLTPSTPTAPLADLTNTGDTRFQGPWTSCGLPTITLPTGLAESGLPVGIQLIAPPFEEARLLAIARWCEKVIDVQLTPPVGG
ncbi:MAG: amidase [Chloroflexi bacterium]|nr:amidase [Chloroflexota bacterium]MCI0862683.1 amidase [Chloroflexota bacterium]MCI0897308.1 amidase [Chloroflexota bacterium]MCI0899278.1 amidase [Chloroflexota bacterium]MCI0902720.1 amidase [Chloroflexota bacterium]